VTSTARIAIADPQLCHSCGTTVATLWRQSVADFDPRNSEKSLRRMVQFAEIFPDVVIGATRSHQSVCPQIRRLQSHSESIEEGDR
jgi:hypothetical protein